MRTVEHTASFELPRPVSEVFPLFSPEGEKRWAPGWDYESVVGTEDPCEDDVFLTKSHDHASTQAIWLVKRFDLQGHVAEFYKVEPGDKVGLVRVRCTAPDDRRTTVEVTYRYAALSETGRAFVAAFTAQAYERFIDEWRRLLSEYFASNR